VDALDEAAVVEHAASVVEAAGRLDVSFNAIAVDHRQVALAGLSVREILGPVADRVATHLITARAAARAHDRPRRGRDPHVHRRRRTGCPTRTSAASASPAPASRR
jgi:3-oxoacyl-[acyl-carrier protein] reductase